MGSAGFFFLPYLGVNRFPLQDLLCKGFPEWDLYLFGAQGHGNPLFYSAIIPCLLVLFLFRAPRVIRGFVAGLSLGIAAHLLWYAFWPVANVTWVPDIILRVGDRIWFAGNAGLALVAAMTMRIGEER